MIRIFVKPFEGLRKMNFTFFSNNKKTIYNVNEGGKLIQVFVPDTKTAEAFAKAMKQSSSADQPKEVTETITETQER